MNTTTVLNPVPDVELVGNPLDLSRTELQGLLDRYCSRSDEAQPGILDPQTALIVRRHPGEEALVRESVANEGWLVNTCEGPGAGNCPLMHGAGCELRNSADAAVVFVDANAFSGSLGTIPRLRCAADSSSPAVVVLEGSHQPPRFLGRSATVGALRGAKEIWDTVKSLLDADGSPRTQSRY